MSQNHLSNNLDKIIQLISIEQVRCLMKQMKIDDSSFSESHISEPIITSNNSNSNASETLEQLNKINNTLLLIVDKISAIESEIKMLKTVKQQRCDDDEEHIKLQIEEKDITSVVDHLNTATEVELEDDTIDEEEEVSETVVNLEAVNLEEEEEDESEPVKEEAEEAVKEEEEPVVNLEEESEPVKEEAEEAVNLEEEEEEVEEEDEAETDESEVEIEDDVADEPQQVLKEEVKLEAVVNLEAVVSETEEEEEVFEIEIDDVTYFATHEENGILYEVDKDGDVGKKVGIIKDGEPIFL